MSVFLTQFMAHAINESFVQEDFCFIFQRISATLLVLPFLRSMFKIDQEVLGYFTPSIPQNYDPNLSVVSKTTICANLTLKFSIAPISILPLTLFPSEKKKHFGTYSSFFRASLGLLVKLPVPFVVGDQYDNISSVLVGFKTYS